MRKRQGEAAVAYWRGLIERQAASGLCIWEFCDRARVSTASFHSWKRKLKSRPATSRGASVGELSPLVPVRVIGDVGTPVIVVEITGGIVVRIPANGDPTMLRAAAHFTCELARGVTGSC
jgi:hypothetical protein